MSRPRKKVTRKRKATATKKSRRESVIVMLTRNEKALLKRLAAKKTKSNVSLYVRQTLLKSGR